MLFESSEPIKIAPSKSETGTPTAYRKTVSAQQGMIIFHVNLEYHKRKRDGQPYPYMKDVSIFANQSGQPDILFEGYQTLDNLSIGDEVKVGIDWWDSKDKTNNVNKTGTSLKYIKLVKKAASPTESETYRKFYGSTPPPQATPQPAEQQGSLTLDKLMAMGLTPEQIATIAKMSTGNNSSSNF